MEDVANMIERAILMAQEASPKEVVKVQFDVDGEGGKQVPTFAFYVAKNGSFEVDVPGNRDHDEFSHKFHGTYFECLGSTYHCNTKGAVVGFEIFEHPYEVIKIEDVPQKLYE